MSRRLTRDEETPVFIFRGPMSAYKEDIIQMGRDNGYRLIDSRGMRKSFIEKMKELEAVAGKKLMFVEGQDVNLLTSKPKEVKVISKSREKRVMETNEALVTAVEQMTAIASKLGASNVDDEKDKEKEEMKKQIDLLTKKLASKSKKAE